MHRSVENTPPPSRRTVERLDPLARNYCCLQSFPAAGAEQETKSGSVVSTKSL